MSDGVCPSTPPRHPDTSSSTSSRSSKHAGASLLFACPIPKSPHRGKDGSHCIPKGGAVAGGGRAACRRRTCRRRARRLRPRVSRRAGEQLSRSATGARSLAVEAGEQPPLHRELGDVGPWRRVLADRRCGQLQALETLRGRPRHRAGDLLRRRDREWPRRVVHDAPEARQEGAHGDRDAGGAPFAGDLRCMGRSAGATYDVGANRWHLPNASRAKSSSMPRTSTSRVSSRATANIIPIEDDAVRVENAIQTRAARRSGAEDSATA